MASLSPSWVSQSTFNITSRRVGHGKVNSNCFYNSCFDNITDSVAMNVNVT